MSMMMDEQVVKGFLRLDTNEDIRLYVDTAEQYFRDATGADPDADKPRDVYAVCAITQELYDNRTLIGSDKGERLRHVISSILDHIRLDQIGGDDDEG